MSDKEDRGDDGGVTNLLPELQKMLREVAVVVSAVETEPGAIPNEKMNMDDNT